MITNHCPLCNKKKLSIVTKISSDELISNYKTNLKIDTNHLLKNKGIIYLLKCKSCYYSFYFPFDIEGDNKFYLDLHKKDWYYMPWKWEHEKSFKLIKPNSYVLEIGCAEGEFIKQLQISKKCKVCGIELNENAAEIAQNKGLNVKTDLIQNHIPLIIDGYDYIAMFQVLEHITEVKDFIQSIKKSLKNNGKLIISVPNNKSFIKYSESTNLLNKPPHHMGCWTLESLKKMALLYDFKIKYKFYEPLQPYHFDWYLLNLEKRLLKIGFPRWLIHFHVIKWIKKLLPYFNNLIKGHTILILLEKK